MKYVYHQYKVFVNIWLQGVAPITKRGKVILVYTTWFGQVELWFHFYKFHCKVSSLCLTVCSVSH